jgi:pimeloyl-ACP methyl ester carboxylesterase
MRHGSFRRDGVDLHYLEWHPEATARPAVLLLHGLGSNATFWARTAAHLGSRRLIALDQRAHGASAAPAEGYEPERLAADAAALVEGIDLGRVVVAGHSWGASIALQLAADRPDLVAGLAIVDGPIRPWTETGLGWEDAEKFMQPPLPVYADLEAAVAERKALLKGSWADDLVEFVRSGLVPEGAGFRLPLTVPIRHQILRSMFFQPYDVQWAQVRAPVLLALANGSGEGPFTEFKQRSARLVGEQVPTAVTRWFDSGHDIPIERPAEVAVEVERTCLRAGWADVTADVLALEGDWNRQTGYQGWSARDLLVHLASTATAMPEVSRSRLDPDSDGARSEPFDSDRWNASQQRRRKEQSVEDLKEELDRAGMEMDGVLAGLPVDEVIGAGAFAGETAAAAMLYMVDHQRDHLEELRRTLGAASVAPS